MMGKYTFNAVVLLSALSVALPAMNVSANAVETGIHKPRTMTAVFTCEDGARLVTDGRPFTFIRKKNCSLPVYVYRGDRHYPVNWGPGRWVKFKVEINAFTRQKTEVEY